jgi:hypothetical protein
MSVVPERLTATLNVLNQIDQACRQDNRIELERIGFFDEALYYACLYGKVSLVMWLLKKAKVYHLGLYGACRAGLVGLSERMYRLDKDHMDEALYNACIGGHRPMIEWVIQKGATGWNYGLQGAGVGGKPEAAAMMIQRGATAALPLKELTPEQLREVTQLAYWSMSDEQRTLVDGLPKPPKPEPAQQDGKRPSALEIACKNNDRRRILQFGNRDHEPFVYACQYGNRELAEWLLQRMKRGPTISGTREGFYHACKNKDWDMMNWLLPMEGIEMMRGMEGACEGGHIEVVEWIKARGTIIHPYMMELAARSGNLELVKIVYQEYMKNYKEMMCGACRGGHMEVIHFVYSQCPYDDHYIWDNALCHACLGGHKQTIDYCIEKGAGNWRSGLRYACLGGNLGAAKEMVNRGAEIDTDMLSLACKSGNTDLVKYLISLRILPQFEFYTAQEDMDMANAMKHACFGGYIDIVELLIEHHVTNDDYFKYIPQEDMVRIVDHCYDKMSPELRESPSVKAVLEPRIRQAMTQLGMPKKMRHGNYSY